MTFSIAGKRNKIDVLVVLLDVSLMLENSPVFQAQVADQLIALQKLGYQGGILCIYGDSDRFERFVGKGMRQHGIKIFKIAQKSFALNLINMAMALRDIRQKHSVKNGYVRGIWGAIVLSMANPLNRLPYLYDVRGDVIDEAQAKGSNIIKISIYSSLERLGLRSARHINAVTRVLAHSIQKRTNINKPVSVIPSCIDLDYFKFSEEMVNRRRNELGYKKEDIVFIYSGGLSHYQKIPQMLDLWRRIAEKHSDVHFLLITKTDPQSLPDKAFSLEYFGPRLNCLSLKRSEIFSTLCAADIGFMMRDDRKLNQAASPVKFAEYIAAGLAVVGSPKTGDVSELIEKQRIGILIDPLRLDDGELHLSKFIKQIRKDGIAIRKRSVNLARSRFDWKAYRDVYYQMYGFPSKSKQGNIRNILMNED